jgi:hypothetical protein
MLLSYFSSLCRIVACCSIYFVLSRFFISSPSSFRDHKDRKVVALDPDTEDSLPIDVDDVIGTPLLYL